MVPFCTSLLSNLARPLPAHKRSLPAHVSLRGWLVQVLPPPDLAGYLPQGMHAVLRFVVLLYKSSQHRQSSTPCTHALTACSCLAAGAAGTGASCRESCWLPVATVGPRQRRSHRIWHSRAGRCPCLRLAAALLESATPLPCQPAAVGNESTSLARDGDTTGTRPLQPAQQSLRWQQHRAASAPAAV